MPGSERAYLSAASKLTPCHLPVNVSDPPFDDQVQFPRKHWKINTKTVLAQVSFVLYYNWVRKHSNIPVPWVTETCIGLCAYIITCPYHKCMIQGVRLCAWYGTRHIASCFLSAWFCDLYLVKRPAANQHSFSGPHSRTASCYIRTIRNTIYSVGLLRHLIKPLLSF